MPPKVGRSGEQPPREPWSPRDIEQLDPSPYPWPRGIDTFGDADSARFLGGGMPAPGPGAAGGPGPVGGGLPDPAPLPKHRGDGHAFKTFGGPLFVGRVEGRDVEQGKIANCYMAAALASIAERRPEAIRDALVETGAGEDGRRHFEVQLFGPEGRTPWPVDDDLLVGPGGRPVYGRWPRERPEELWHPLLEKALIDFFDAQAGGARRGYAVGNEGGSAFDVFEALLGARPQNYRLKQHQHRPDAVLDLVEGALERREPVVAYTYDKSHAEQYRGTGLAPWHTYAVFGVHRDTAPPTVELYNPWSSGEPGDDGKDDGVFHLPVQDFLRHFRNLNVAHDPRVG